MNTQLSTVQLQISEAGQLKSDLLSFQSSLSSLIDGGNLLPSPSVANSSVATATLPSGSSGATSSYSLEVTQLAKPQTMASSSMASSTTVQGGTLTFNFGTVTNGTFAADSTHAAATITIPDGSSLSAVASQINSASMGVTAYVTTNTDGTQQLVMKGAEGAANAFTISASGTGTTGTTSLSALAYDPSTASGNYSVTQPATNAAYTLDGVARTSTSNTIANAAPGLSLKLTGTNTGNPTTVSFGDASSGITTAMQNITSVLNQLVGEMNTDTAAGAGLANDSGAKAMARQFSQLAGTVIMPNAAAGAPKTLADLGLATNKDGTFTLDTSKLATALQNNPSAVAAMFTKSVNGVYATVNKMVSALTTSADINPGSLAGSVARYTTLQSSITTQQSNLATLQSQLQTRLTTQYAATDATVATYNSTLSYLKQQIAAWNNTNSNN
ncbi:flagellar filament capping protein FliD [Novosphingobium rosa]|uniref:flagellar filament capping protein FliD n=1 Tax=Novosphingobium rosa TaxID=76978 RepID=UPI001FE1B91A|nr:flagellar filament capping protein FliD [Novosphingobium rosa]